MQTYKTNSEIFEQKAEILKALAHPVRLCIIQTLYHNGPTNVTDMHNCLDKPQSTISQHISKLKSANIIVGKRQGTEIIYSIKNDQIKEIIRILF
ncbi:MULTISPECIES: ArsR/SmtB family transcription factor [Crassaminicella]|uniref:Helix-turn-helix transcriptional regulator n=2 Tax=Crassaminicella TaxID=1848399 RepID=A0A5C0SGN2_CRATE|nr:MULTISPECIES: metalloregulator ArsR/SmtB family transcription factor [Crassaminicella]QEK13471.1 helix-turn-helix transcriptional regulator [Crassaminicella thermophila]QXM07077.1 metalloregulator ArsR/SmtB family transcription factor [Crassaminicella indica]